MGLDNSINVLNTKDESKRVAYWRRCWKVREDILTIVQRYKICDDCYYIPRKELFQITKKCFSYNSRNWGDKYLWKDIYRRMMRKAKWHLLFSCIISLINKRNLYFFHDSY